MIKLRRLRVWGIKDGKRVYIDQQGPSLTVEPDIPEIAEAEDVLEQASSMLDELIDVWTGCWDTDERMQEWADTWNKHENSSKLYDIAAMREVEYDQFLRNGFRSCPRKWCMNVRPLFPLRTLWMLPSGCS